MDKLIQQDTQRLQVSEEELTDIVEVCFVFSRNDGVDVTEWNEVYEKYGGDD